jgi:hypothetical protein
VFDPDEVARLETAMWRSYYDRRRLPLFGQLVALLQGQFHLQPLRAVTLAGLAARAADDWDRIEAVPWVAWRALADEVRLVRVEEQEARKA